jgi:hypothetical protein
VCSLACLVVPGASAQSVSVAPDARSVIILVRTSLIALDQANRTGNYGVLRELGSPSFRAANSEARLAEIFANLREHKLDMQAAAVLEPRFTREAFVDEKNLLRMAGVVPTRPRATRFELAFELAAGQWRLFGLAVAPEGSGAPAPAR